MEKFSNFNIQKERKKESHGKSENLVDLLRARNERKFDDGEKKIENFEHHDTASRMRVQLLMIK